MKYFKSLLILIILSSQFSNAQFDDKFYFPKKELRPIKIPHSEHFIKVEEDTIHTVFFKPTKTPKATILFFHGAGGNISTYTFMIKQLVTNNYQVYAVDFRGYGKSTGKPTHVNIAKDVEIIYKEMLKVPEIKNTKLLVYGASMGCQIATHFTKKHQQEINGLIFEGGFASFKEVALVFAPKEQYQIIKKYIQGPYRAKDDIKDIVIPKLFIHSKEDESIPMSQAKIVFNNALEPKEFLEFTGGHIEALTSETKRVISAIDNLLTTEPIKSTTR